MNNTVRRLTIEYLDDYYELVHAAYGQISTENISFAAIHSTKEEMADWLKLIPTYGLFKDEKIVSVVSIRYPWGPQPGYDIYPHIGRLATDPLHAGKKYAKTLYYWVEENILIEKLKTPYITLGTANNDKKLVSMYKKWGFEPQFEKKLEGNTHTTIFLKKSLVSSKGV